MAKPRICSAQGAFGTTSGLGASAAGRFFTWLIEVAL